MSSDEEIFKEIVKQCSTHNSDQKDGLDFNEFKAAFINHVSLISENNLKEVFNHIDINGDG